MPKYNYVLWKHERVKNNVTLNKFDGFESEWKMTAGVSVAKGFPKDARFFMHSDRPNDTVLTDDLRNLQSMIVASERLKEFLQGENLLEIEFLPVAIVDHKKKPIKQAYFVVNPISPISCLDKASKIQMSPIAPERIANVDKLVIDEKKVDPKRLIFRLAGLSGPVFVHRKLAAKIDAQKFAGLGWEEIDTYATIK